MTQRAQHRPQDPHDRQADGDREHPELEGQVSGGSRASPGAGRREHGSVVDPVADERDPVTPRLQWLAGMLILLIGVAIRIAGNRAAGADILILGALVLILSRVRITRR